MQKRRSLPLKSGQVVTEYIMLLTIVVVGLAATKIKIANGSLSINSTDQGAKTVMQLMSDSFTVWMQDMFIIISLPS